MAFSDLWQRNSRPAAQAIIVVAILGLAVMPPVAGKLLLVPLDGRPAASTFALALDHHMLPLATGPLPGSIVATMRDGEFLALLDSGVLTLPAFSAGCASGRSA